MLSWPLIFIKHPTVILFLIEILRGDYFSNMYTEQSLWKLIKSLESHGPSVCLRTLTFKIRFVFAHSYASSEALHSDAFIAVLLFIFAICLQVVQIKQAWVAFACVVGFYHQMAVSSRYKCSYASRRGFLCWISPCSEKFGITGKIHALTELAVNWKDTVYLSVSTFEDLNIV